jgi:hypothetical protein
MPDNTSLTPVLIGGGLAIGGVLITGLVNILFAWRKDKSEEKNKRRDKYEEFVKTLYETDHWIKTLERIKIRESGEIELPPPFAKVEAILHVYFSDLDETISPLIRAADRYLSMIHLKSVNMRNTRQPISAHDADDLNKCENEYHKRLTECLDYLREWAPRELN